MKWLLPVLLISMLVFACSQEATVETKPLPEAPVVKDVAPESVPEVIETTEEATAQAQILPNEEPVQELASEVGDVMCDEDNMKITFTITNNGDVTWQLDQKVPFPAPADLKPVKVFVNKYEVNSGSTQYHPDTREVMFGPNKLFSDNCGGVEELAPGRSVTCTIYPVKLNRGSGSEGLKDVNLIFIDSPGLDEYIEFIC